MQFDPQPNFDPSLPGDEEGDPLGWWVVIEGVWTWVTTPNPG
jgi:hypothetical protein